jgi:hypothetical protein
MGEMGKVRQMIAGKARPCEMGHSRMGLGDGQGEAAQDGAGEPEGGQARQGCMGWAGQGRWGQAR